MGFFGLGTSVAVMTTAVFSGHLLRSRIRNLFHKLSMLILLIMGLYFVSVGFIG